MIRGADLVLALTGVGFVAVYYGLRAAGVPGWAGDALYLFPPALAAAVHLRRARRETGRGAWFFRLVGAAAGLWAIANLLWTLAGRRGLDPLSSSAGSFQLPMETLFLGFLVPLIGAVALRPHPPVLRREAPVVADVSLLTLALGFLFARLSLGPQIRRLDEGWSSGVLIGLETLVLAVWSVGLWRFADDPGWKRTYGCLGLFAAGYGIFHFAGSGAGGGEMPPPGSLLDLVWIVPFFFLAAAALPKQDLRCPRLSGWTLLLIAGPGPLVFDLVFDRLLPQSLPGHESHTPLLLIASALLTLAAAASLYVEDRAATRTAVEARAGADEEQRAGRLAALSSLSATVVRDLERAVDAVVDSAGAAVEAMGDKGERALQQAQRARAVVQQAAAALSLARRGPRREVLLGAIVEDAVSSAVEEGLGLRVSLDGFATLPPVLGDPASLREAFSQLIRNAAQASPGGVLEISAERRLSEILVRFHDDGPGVPPEHRHRIFDPFFTTRRVGDGVGLGLTLVHFVARDHRGSVVLEPSETGACFALRLPVWERRVAPQARASWPFAAAVLAAAALASVLVLLPMPGPAGVGSQAFTGAAAAAAGVALGNVALRRQGRERTFWALLAAGPAIWVLLQIARLIYGAEALGLDAAWPLVAYAAAEITWAAALLVRPDRKELARPAWLPMLGAGSALLIIAYLYLYMVVLPAPFAVADPGVLHQIAVGRGVLRAGLVGWAGILVLRGLTSYWRALFGRLALVIGVWAVGHTVAAAAVARPSYAPGTISDVGWFVPFLVLAGLGVSESLTKGAGGPRAAVVTHSALRSGLSLAGLAAIPAFDALVGDTGLVGLDGARDVVSRTTVVVVGLLLAVREFLSHREMATTRQQLEGARSQLRDAERRSRLVGFLSGAAHELAGHLSGITSFVRLLLAQPDLTQRVRGDLGRIQERTDGALRIVRNLTALSRTGPRELDVLSVNEVAGRVVELRRADFAQEGIRVEAVLEPRVPALPLDAFALQHALLGLVDNAVLAVRRSGSEGAVVVRTRLDEAEVVVSVTDDGPGLPPRLLRSLGRGGRAAWTESGLGLRLASQVAEQHGGTLSGRNRPEGGAELELRLPVVARSRQGNAG